MNYEAITEAISNLGFPIVIAGILLYLLYKEQTKDDGYIDKMIEALNNNTAVMSEVKSMVMDLKDMVIDLKGVVLSLTRRLDRLEADKGVSDYVETESEDTVHETDEKTG